jgi:hypothetical protein
MDDDTPLRAHIRAVLLKLARTLAARAGPL